MTHEWDYDGDFGCTHWSEIGYDIAGLGKKQSPIDIPTKKCTKMRAREKPLITKPLKPFAARIINTGFTIKVSPVKRKLEHVFFEGEEYGLIQFHFHAPSEHNFDDEEFQLELHLVHESTKEPGKLLVIGFMFEADGEENEFLKIVFDEIPPKVKYPIPMNDISFKGLDFACGFYKYDGSLTTPPCTECVTWIVVKEVHEMSREQLNIYLKHFPESTNRPCQLINGREIISVGQ